MLRKAILTTFLILIISGSVAGQIPKEYQKPLKGMWVKEEGPRDTLKFYMEKYNESFISLYGQDLKKLLQGYDIQVNQDSARLTGMCSGDRGNKYFKLDTLNRTLVIEDFYNGTNSLYRFRKISDTCH